MGGRKKDPAATEATRQRILETGFRLFSQRNIDTVSMGEIAKDSGVAAMTVYRYFNTKPGLVVAVATWKWEQILQQTELNRPHPDFDGMTAAEVLGYCLNTFLGLYKNNKELLRFNQFFNVYSHSEKLDEETLFPYVEIIGRFEKNFGVIHKKAALDRTVRTDIPAEEMFLTILHLMLAAVTRYAVGLVYSKNEDDAMTELQTLKQALLREYTVNPD